MGTTAVSTPERSGVEQDLGIVDCDVHPTFREGLADLAPYLDGAWKARLGVGDAGAGTDMFGRPRSSRIEMPKSPFFTPSPGAFRKDAMPPDGCPPASSPAFLVEHHLDSWGIDRALLLGQPALTIGAYPNADVAARIATAFNDWIADVWLDHDPRFRAALAVAPQDPERAVAEVHRAAALHPGFAAVFLPVGSDLLGDVRYHPIYAAAVEEGLPVTIHINGVEGTFPTAAAIGGGMPATYFEYKTVVPTAYQTNLASLVISGTFERFPELRVAMVECGLAWLVELLWRMDTNWKALRDEAPWVKRAPSEYVYEHVRFTSQPFVEPPNKTQLSHFLEMIRAEEILLFASDYPHYDFDNPLRVLNTIPRGWRDRVASGNALDFFGERLSRPLGSGG